MSDYILRGTAAADSIRIFAMTSKEMVQKAHDAHNTTNVATAALGRLLTGGAIMGSMLKNTADVLTIQVGCSGPIKGLTVTANPSTLPGGREKINVKGYCINPNVDLPLRQDGKLDVGGALGAGILTVIKDMGLKEPFSGQTELVTGEIAEDLTYYFATSEQTPTAVALGVLMENEGGIVKCAGGLIVQLLPFAEEEVIAKLEDKISHMEPVTAMLNRGMTPEDICNELFGDMDLRINERVEAEFKCDCSKERVSKAILSIDRKEIVSMIEDGKPVEVNCHFCNTSYNFSVDELKDILEFKDEEAKERGEEL